MPNQFAVRAAGDCDALALPDDDSDQFAFDGNRTPMWLYDLDTHRFVGLTPGVVTPSAVSSKRNSGSRRRWRRSVNSPAAWRTISTMF